MAATIIEEIRMCNFCQKLLPVAEFPVYNKNGVHTARCYECLNMISTAQHVMRQEVKAVEDLRAAGIAVNHENVRRVMHMHGGRRSPERLKKYCPSLWSKDDIWGKDEK